MCIKENQKMVQVHLHTDASLLDGCASPKKLISKAKELGHPAIAISDHGNPSNLFQFAKEAKRQGIKPILGLEFYINNDLRSRISNKERNDIEERDYHQSVFIKNKAGYLNFNKLTYISFTDGYYYKPRIDFDALFQHKNGLMITSSCMASKIGNYIRNNQHRQAEELFKKYYKEFGEDFYGEIQFNEVKGQKEINDFIIHMCKKFGIKTLIGGDVHYLNKNDNVLQDAIIRSKRDSEVDWVIDARNLYYHDIPDYYRFNKEFGFNYKDDVLEDAFANSLEFADKVNFEFETGNYHLPKINTAGFTSTEYIEKITWEGAANRIDQRRKYGENITDELIDEYERRIKYELKVIKDLGVADYLLIVQDIISWEKKQGFYVGPGRGSAAGSLVAYLIGISDLCPVTHRLVFERFINPERKILPDIDWDSSDGAREAILTYLIDKYGKESVCNVPTYGRYKLKSALQAMSRGLKKDTGHDTVLMKKITKLPEVADLFKEWKIDEVFPYFKKLREKTSDNEIINWIDNNQDTLDFTTRILDQVNQLGMHAGGIVITPGPIYDFMPVTRGSGNLLAAFREADGSSKDLGELGILKLDVLGVSTLNVLKFCVDNIRKDKGIDLMDVLPYLDITDKKIMDYFMEKSPYGIFQMERGKMFTSKIKVDCFDDIVAINAINRPGPDKYIDKYGYWKAIDKGEIKVSKEELEEINVERYPLPFMEKILKETYGCLIFQEQLMFLLREAAGFDLGEADSFRRCLGWTKIHPKYYILESYFKKLEESLNKMGYSKKDFDLFIELCRDFAGYSFNRSHAVCYAYIAFQTLYFKCYYPAYFFAGMINNNENNIEKISEIIADAKECKIKILPHSINKSKYKTAVEDDSSVRLGFGMIKGFGDAVRDELEELKLYECTSLNEILQKPFKKINTTQIQNLIELGAFDEFKIDRDKIEFLKNLFQDSTIEKWFTRVKQTLRLEVIPKILKENFNEIECLKIAMRVRNELEPWKLLVDELIKTLNLGALEDKKYLKETIAKQKELLGFSLSADNKLKELVYSFKAKGILPVSEYEGEDKKYYFQVEKKTVVATKTGKKYLTLVLNDGLKSVKAKCWREIDLQESEIYWGRFKKDTYGFTLNDRDVVKF